MENIITDTSAPKQSANLRNNTKIARQAKSEQWLAENKKSFEGYNRRVTSNGTFSDGLRRF